MPDGRLSPTDTKSLVYCRSKGEALAYLSYRYIPKYLGASASPLPHLQKLNLTFEIRFVIEVLC